LLHDLTLSINNDKERILERSFCPPLTAQSKPCCGLKLLKLEIDNAVWNPLAVLSKSIGTVKQAYGPIPWVLSKVTTS
jgi:hypothetical protein